jgi:Zn-dependent M28 family amino/carboxypeptidase
MARILPRRQAKPAKLTYWLVFFDGEEAIRPQWSPSDSLYGSRHFVAKLSSTGELSRVKAMFLVDMIADAKLTLEHDMNSTAWLRDLVFDVARRLGYARHLSSTDTVVEDDHIPFVNAGVSAVDLIDLDYGPNRSYWHTETDSLDHCSPLSLTISGRIVTAALQELENSPRLN